MDDTIIQHPASAEQKPRLTDREYCESWRKTRGLSPDSFEPHFYPPSFETTPRFGFTNFDHKGMPRPDAMPTRWDRDEDKYTVPKGSGSIIVALKPDTLQRWEASREKLMAEGEGKGAAMEDIGIPCPVFRGCDAWHLKDELGLHPDLAPLVRPGDIVTFAMDGDWRTNPRVREGARKLFDALAMLGASPLMLDIPNGLGLDDYLYGQAQQGISPQAALAVLPRLHKADIPTGYTVDKNNPVGASKDFLGIHHQHQGKPTLKYHCKVWYEWHGQGWQAMENDNTVRTRLYDFAEGHTAAPEGRNRGTVLNDRLVSSVADALKAAANLERFPIDHGNYLACANGMLNPDNRTLRPPDPDIFNLNWSEVEHSPDAACPRWEAFLEQVYADPSDPAKVDDEAIRLLQEFMGYTLTDDTRQQKMLMMIGAKRSGKGTIARVWEHVIGASAVAGTNLPALGKPHGMAPLVGKRLCVIADARLSGRDNTQGVVEAMLNITGEDTVEINGKYRQQFSTRLPTRILIMTNVLPNLVDEGGALASRIMLLYHPNSFFGREDTRLTEKLVQEAPGILNWALRGRDRLQKRRRFIQPASSEEEIARMIRLSSPMKCFISDMCVLGEGHLVPAGELRMQYVTWMQGNGSNMNSVGGEMFYSRLRAAWEQEWGPVIGAAKNTRVGKGQVKCYHGIALAKDNFGPKHSG